MNSTRHISQAEPATDSGSPLRGVTTTAEPTARWPVLAQIVEINRVGDGPGAGAPPPDGQTTYRIDAPHASISGTAHVELSAVASTAPERAPRDLPASEERPAPAESVPGQVAAGIWQILEPYQPALRFAAMVALMAAGGASAMLMMSMRSKPIDSPAIPATSSDHTISASAELHSAQLQPVLESVPEGGDDPSTAEPTAKGPVSQPAREMAINDIDQADEAADVPSVPAYPTTPYAVFVLPPAEAGDRLPQVRTSEPEVALRGELLQNHLR